MASKGRVFKGTPRTAVLAQPFIAPAHPGYGKGIPLGIDLRTHQPVRIDPHQWWESGLVNGLITRVDGIRGAGKSALMKSLTLRMMALQAGLDEQGYPRSFRVRITDQKPEDGQPEYTALTEALHSKVISPMSAGKINPFDPQMGDALSMLETSINLSETVLGRPLQRFEPLAHQIAVSKMYYGFYELSSPELLERIMRGLTTSDIDDYYQENDAALKQSFEERLNGNGRALDELRPLLERPNIIPRQEFEHDAAQMAASMTQLLHGDYGNLFGNGISMRELLSQPVATIDRTGMSLKVRTIFEALMWRWQTWALEHNDLDLIPHLNIGDEEHDSYRSLMYLRFYDDYVRKARAFHTFDIKATQYSSRLNKMGAEGSEARELAQSINLGVAIRLIGKQPYDTEILDDLSNLGLSEQDAEFCTQLPQGCFGLKLPDWPVIFFQYLLTPIELELVKSNAANTRMLERRNVYSFESLRRLAQDDETLTVGAEHELSAER